MYTNNTHIYILNIKYTYDMRMFFSRLGNSNSLGFRPLRSRHSPFDVQHWGAGGELSRPLSVVTLGVDRRHSGVLSGSDPITLHSKPLGQGDLFPGCGEYQSIRSRLDGARHLWSWRFPVNVKAITRTLESWLPTEALVRVSCRNLHPRSQCHGDCRHL